MWDNVGVAIGLMGTMKLLTELLPPYLVGSNIRRS